MAVFHPSSLLPALLLMGFSTAWAATLALRPREGEAMAALYPPGTSAEQSLAAATGVDAARIVAFGNWPSVILVRSDQPGLPARLRAAGAWLVVRAPLTAGCLRQAKESVR